ncbi:MAG: Mur ligase family protein [Patescibacteria group bacterium]
MPKYKYLEKFNNKKIALLGLGLDNQALLELLKSQKVKAEITIKDARQDPKGFNKNLYQFDILFRSPGWPILCPGIQEALNKGKTEMTSPLNLFFALCPSKNIIGVSGTKGKGTTASLIYQILKDSGKKVWLGGNIGIAPLGFLNKIKASDYVVLELSSFQLEDLKFSPMISVITNLYKEHLAPADPNNPNFHNSYSKYWQAKLNIAKNIQNKYLVINSSLKSKVKKIKLPGKLVYFSASQISSKLVGTYNKENIGAALEVAKILKINNKSAEKSVAKFGNLEHRLELVEEINKIKYFDNSFSTTPESTVLDLKSFTTPIIQIAGGADKGASFKDLAKTMKAKVKFLILLPGNGTKNIKKELIKIKFPNIKFKEVENMEEAVRIAEQKAVAGDTVLLSTGCASFGIFKNYKERGDLFKKYVRN